MPNPIFFWYPGRGPILNFHFATLASTSRIGHDNNIPTMQVFTGISKNTQSKSYMQTLTECLLEFQNYALRDTH